MTTVTKTRTRKSSPVAQPLAQTAKPAVTAAVTSTLEAITVAAYRGYKHPTVLRQGKYACGQTAIRGFDASTKEPVYMATIALQYKPQQGCVWIKTWSENSGLVDQLIIAGVISLTGRVQNLPGSNLFALEGRLLA